MFTEPSTSGKKRGWIEVICGSMFSGKTEELIRRLRRAEYARLSVEIFKPEIDKRYDDTLVVSHNETSIRSTPISHSSNLLLLGSGIEVIGVDEAQFFDEGLPAVCTALALQGSRIIVAGLDKDYLGAPFGPIPQLLTIGDYITKLQAICVFCGELATYSYRKTANESRVLLGEKDTYDPVCRNCFYDKMQDRPRLHLSSK